MFSLFLSGLILYMFLVLVVQIGRFCGVSPLFNRLKQPCPSDQFFLQQSADARIGREIGNRRFEQLFERFYFPGKAPALVALDDRDDFREFGLISASAQQVPAGQPERAQGTSRTCRTG